jgi:diguanylate cyclase (GGDEF)-like protein
MNLLAAEAAVAIDRADLLRRLESMARTDDLTGLPNRRAWEEELPRELARATRGEQPVSVAMLDLDRFKGFNDDHGHQAGDRLLKEAAGAWREALRDTDLLARYGGEEFSVILADCALADARELVERLRAHTPEGVTCSAGIAEWDREETPDSLVGRADAALYEAKRTGRDRTVASPGVTSRD